MSKFYFKSMDNDGVYPPDEGYEFANIGAAIEQAEIVLAEMALDGLPRAPDKILAIEVEDENRRAVFTMRLMLQIEYHSPLP